MLLCRFIVRAPTSPFQFWRRGRRAAIDRSGVWRFREAVMDIPEGKIVSHPEGDTRLYERDPDQCCALRKVEPLERALSPYTAWINGMRREEAATRANIPVVSYDAKRDMVKISPLAVRLP